MKIHNFQEKGHFYPFEKRAGVQNPRSPRSCAHAGYVDADWETNFNGKSKNLYVFDSEFDCIMGQ